MKNRYERYRDDIYGAGKQIVLKDVTISPSNSFLGKFRDKATFYKAAWQSATGWISFPKEFVYWTSLTPLSIASVNEFLKIIHFPFYIPLSWGSVIAIGLIISVMALGIWSWTKMGLTKRGSEINALQNSSQYLLYSQHIDIVEQNDKIIHILEDIRDKL